MGDKANVWLQLKQVDSELPGRDSPEACWGLNQKKKNVSKRLAYPLYRQEKHSTDKRRERARINKDALSSPLRQEVTQGGRVQIVEKDTDNRQK